MCAIRSKPASSASSTPADASSASPTSSVPQRRPLLSARPPRRPRVPPPSPRPRPRRRPSARRRPPRRPSAPRSSPRSPRPRLRRPPRPRLPPRPRPRLRPRRPPRWTLSSKRLLPPNSASAASTANARSMTGRSCVQGRSARVVARKPWFSPSKRGFRATTASAGPLQALPSLDRRTPRRAATPRPKGRLRPIPLRRGARRAARSTSCTRPAPRL